MFLDRSNPSMNELVHWFQVNYTALANDMKQSNHAAVDKEPNPYHLEDSVFSHTMMVCLQAENNNCNKVVYISALLHDIGKPEARDIIPFEASKPVHSESNEKRNIDKEQGNDSKLNRVMPVSGLKSHFRGHEGLSFYRGIEILNKLEEEQVINLDEKIQILTIVSLHGTLFDSIKEGKEYKPEKVIAKFKDIQLYRDFVSQVKNDSTGRFFMSKDGRKSDATLLGKEIYNDETFRTHYVPNVGLKNYPYITLLVGVPASGKTTWRDQNVFGNTVTLSRDDIMMDYAKNNNFEIKCSNCYGEGVCYPPGGAEGLPHKCGKCNDGIASTPTYSEIWKYLEDNDLHKEVDAIEQSIFKEAVKDRKNIVVDRTNMSRKSRRKWLTNVPKDYFKEAVVFATVYEDVYSRNKKRAQETGKNITNHLIGNMMRQFIIPTYDEVDNIKWVF